MRQASKLGVVGSLVLLLAGCGGTVALETEDDGAGGAPAGSGGAPDSAAGAGGVGAVSGATGGSAGSGDTDGHTAVLVYDADVDGLGRIVYISSLEPNCREALTDPSVQAKQPAFSADGTHLAYAALVDGIYQIHVRDLESGNAEQVTHEPVGATSPAFSPDGSQLAFVTGDPETPGNAQPGAGSLMLVDLETSDVTLVSDREVLGCCTPQYLSPSFNGADEILVGTRMSLVGIELSTGNIRDLVPITGRIPNPQDPSKAPDGLRYVFSDHCGLGLRLYVARLDGSSGDTCSGALAIETEQAMISADWGGHGYIAAEIKDARGVLLIDDTDFSVTPFGATGARNPAWAPVDANTLVACE
jgi:hypothetical protein